MRCRVSCQCAMPAREHVGLLTPCVARPVTGLAELQQKLHAAEAAQAAAQEALQQRTAERDAAQRDLEAAAGERDAAQRQLEGQRAELAAAQRDLQAAAGDGEAAQKQLEERAAEARRQLDSAAAEREELQQKHAAGIATVALLSIVFAKMMAGHLRSIECCNWTPPLLCACCGWGPVYIKY